jgi:MFS family permease
MRLAAATLPDRFGYRPVLIPTFLGLVVLFVLLAATETVALFVVAAALGGFGHGIVFPILSSEAVNRSRVNERGSALAFFTALFDISTLVVVPLVGAIIDGPGYTAAFNSVAVLLVLALLAFGIADRRVMPAGRMAESPS